MSFGNSELQKVTAQKLQYGGTGGYDLPSALNSLSLNSFAIMQTVTGKPASSAISLTFVAHRALTIPADFAGSQVAAGTAATASTTFTVKKNGGSSIGTFVFAISDTVATLATTGTPHAAISLVPGDILTVTAPTQDATLQDIGFTIVATIA